MAKQKSETRMAVNKHEIRDLLRQGESLRLEFKSDLKCLPDRELVAAVVALANTEGGDLLLGVEDDGTVLYQKAGKKAEYIRQAGFAPIQQEQMVLNYIDKHGSIKRADAADLCHISPFQTTRLLKRLENNDLLKTTGRGKGTRYERK